jgi:hypothetical protein
VLALGQQLRYALSGGIGSGLRELAMDAILRIVQKTPFWVLALLAIPVVLGIHALKARTISVWRLLIVPAVFILVGVISVLLKATAFPILVLDWLITGAIGAAIAWLTAGLDGVVIDRLGRTVRMPGSPVPLVRNLSIFIAKYG